ncbi:MAG: 4-hydroxy-tetrahydrodipicolinate synthase [Alphaproteobacteria bacterium]
MNHTLHSSIVAIVTPFKNGKVDEAALRGLVEWHIAEGTTGIVPVGTTGESPTLSHEEHHRVVDVCIEAAAGKCKIIAGAGSNSTAEAIDLAQHGETAGADAVLVVTPYYNKPNQEGLYQHYKAIHDAINIPVIIYNIPGRSVIDMTPETMGRLAELPRISGVKDATGESLRPYHTKKTCGDSFAQLTGEDAAVLPFMVMGGHGCISVTANVAPRLCAEFHAAWRAGDVKKAQEINDRLMPLHLALFTDTNPAPAKYALAKMGRISEELRLPMVPASAAARANVDAALVHAGLTND